jgi:hypothetical protein
MKAKELKVAFDGVAIDIGEHVQVQMLIDRDLTNCSLHSQVQLRSIYVSCCGNSPQLLDVCWNIQIPSTSKQTSASKRTPPHKKMIQQSRVVDEKVIVN